MSSMIESKFLSIKLTSIFVGTETTREARASNKILEVFTKLLSQGTRAVVKQGAQINLSDIPILRAWVLAIKKISKKS